MHIANAKEGKQLGRTLERFMSRLGYEMKLGEALDALGVMAGFDNWAGLKDSISESALDRRLPEVCRRHIRESEGDEYGPEFAVIAHNGFELRYETQSVTYLRVCDPLGREIAYWTSDEWKEAPEEVMTAIMGAWMQGDAVSVGERKRGRRAAPSPTDARRLPVIQDVPFDHLSSVTINYITVPVMYIDSRVIGQLHQTTDIKGADEEDGVHPWSVAVEFVDDVDFRQESLLLEDLQQMKWDSSQNCFVGKGGSTYGFNIASTFADYFRLLPAEQVQKFD